MKLTEDELMFGKALMLAITAPTEKLSNECLAMAEAIGSDLTDKEKELSQMGIEVALEALKRVKK